MTRRAPVVSTTIALIALGLALPLAAQDMAELEVDHALTMDFPTPHTDWAQPYAHGKTRVLFFVDGRGTNPRECVEVMQRFEIEAEAVFWAQIVDSVETHWHGGATGERRMLNLLEKQWDAYVFLGLDLTKMSPEQQYKVLRPVTDGAGIVFVGANDARVLKDKNRLTELPPFLAQGPVGEAFTVGNGRGIRLPKQPSIQYAPGWETVYDYWAQRLGNAILWAAGKEPKAQIALSIDKSTFARDEGAQITGQITGTLLQGKAWVRKRYTSHTGEPVPIARVAMIEEVSSPGAVSERVPALPAGDYHFDVWLRSDKGIESWASVPFTVTSSRRVSELKLHETWGEPGDSIAGTVSLEGEPLPDETLQIELLDRRGRVLARRSLAASNDPVQFDFQIEPWFPMLVTVRARLITKMDEVSRSWQFFRVCKRNRGQFNFLMWDVPRGTLAPYAEESLVKHSVTLQLSGGVPPPYLSAFDVAWVPYTTRIMAQRDANGIMKPFCWNDAEAVRAHVQQKAQDYLGAREHGVFVYSLGDEVDTKGACLSPHCAEAYRVFLQEQYGTLDALNASWGTDFRAWSEVGLADPTDSDEAVSLREKNYPRWFDRQAYKSWNFVRFCGAYKEAYRGIDPEAMTGFEGAGVLEHGDDLDLIIRSNDFWSPYPGMADEVVRSLAPRSFPRSNWMGYTKDADSLLQKYWRMVTRGCDSVWWWRWDCIGRFHGWLAPDLRPFPAVAEILEDTQIVRDGLGDLLLRSEMLDDGIAVLYSHPSVYAHNLDEGASYGGYVGSHSAVHTMVRELGMQFRYVSDRMLRLGEFDANRYKALILPRAEAIGDAEAEVIRNFASAGGTVMADVRPGIYDGHCKPRNAGVLDDLFGIERTAKPSATKVEIEGIGAVKADTGVRVTTGVAQITAGGAPLFIANKVGAGSAYMTNFDMSSYPRLDVADTPEEIAEGTRDLLGKAGIFPRYRLVGENGLRERNVETVRWANGSMEIVALFRTGGLETNATMFLPQPRFVYDLRNRKSLGQVDRFPVRIIPNRATFLVFATKAVPQAKLTVDPPETARGTVATVRVSVPGAEGLHAFRIRVTNGREHLDWLDQIVIVGEEAAEFPIPVAFNDPTGRWQVEATDLFTNEPVTAELAVR